MLFDCIPISRTQAFEKTHRNEQPKNARRRTFCNAIYPFGERNGIAGKRSRAYVVSVRKESARGYPMRNRFNLFVQKS